MTPIEPTGPALSDECLMAYADDRLPPDEAALVRQRLMHDDEARRRVEAFALTRRHLRLLDDTLHEPLPDRLEALRTELLTTPRPTPRTAGGPSWRQWLRSWRVAGATGLAGLAVGVLLGLLGPRLAGPPADEPARAAAAWASLPQAVLDRTPSSTPVLIGDTSRQRTITPFATIALASGGHCREYTDVAAGGAEAWRVLACRDPAGHWQPRVVLAEPSGGAGSPDYRPASAGLAEFDALVERTAPGRILTPDEEAGVLGRW